DMLAKAAQQHAPSGTDIADSTEPAGAAQVVEGLRRRLASEISLRERVERRLQAVTEDRDGERRQRHNLQRHERELRDEIESVELALGRLLPAPERDDGRSIDLTGATLLYVGGRPHQIAQMRQLAGRWNATLLHHDGGIDDRSGL